LVESLSGGGSRCGRRSRPLDGRSRVAVVLLSLAWWLACTVASPTPPPVPQAPAAAEALQPTLVGGRADLTLPAKDGSTYRIVASLEGESGIQAIGDDPSGAWRDQRDSSDLELVYHAVPAPRPPPGERGAALVLDALRHRTIYTVPGSPAVRGELELADDRLRTIEGEDVAIDLRGAQPREGLTPRMLLDRSFGLLRQDLAGRVVALAPQGLPPAKRFLRPLELRPAIEAAQLRRPTEPVAVGASWSGAYFPLIPAGRLGLRLDATWEFTGF